MEQVHRDAIGRALTNAALFYDRPDLDRPKISAMISVIAEAFPEANGPKILQALAAYRADPKNTVFPSPAKLQPYLRPVANDESTAIEAVNRILTAVNKFGYPNATEARAFVGEAGWNVVRDYGGWEILCQNLGVELSEQTFRAQARESIKAKINLQRAGLLGQPLALPGGSAPLAIAAPDETPSIEGQARVIDLVTSAAKDIP